MILKINSTRGHTGSLLVGNYVNQVHHTTNTRESREVKIKINFACFTFVYAGNMLFYVVNIFTSR